MDDCEALAPPKQLEAQQQVEVQRPVEVRTDDFDHTLSEAVAARKRAGVAGRSHNTALASPPARPVYMPGVMSLRRCRSSSGRASEWMTSRIGASVIACPVWEPYGC